MEHRVHTLQYLINPEILLLQKNICTICGRATSALEILLYYMMPSPTGILFLSLVPIAAQPVMLIHWLLLCQLALTQQQDGFSSNSTLEIFSLTFLNSASGRTSFLQHPMIIK